jgi:hypothetical protein
MSSVSFSGLWDGLITRPEESYCVSKYDNAEGKGISQVSVVHENCCKPILMIENNERERERG